MALRIAFVLDDTLDSSDGVQQYVLALGREFGRRGHDIHYIAGDSRRQDVANIHSVTRTIPVRFNRNRMRTPLPPSGRVLRDVLDKGHFDVVHIQSPFSPFFVGRVAGLAAGRARVVSTFHIAPHSRFVRIANRGLNVLVARQFAKVDTQVAVSDVAASFARDVYHLDCQVIPCPVDVEFPARFRTQRSTHDQAPTIVFLGRIVERKGPDLLLDALSYGCERGLWPAGTTVAMVGDGPLRSRLESASQSIGLPVRWLGSVSEEEKYRTLARADVAVFPATGGESFGIVLPEAMAAGSRVVIAGDNPGYRTTMAGSDGQVVNPRDPVALAEAIARGLTDPDFIAACQEYQEARVRTFDVRRVADQLEALYTGG